MGFIGYFLVCLVICWLGYSVCALVRDIRNMRKSRREKNVKVDDDTKNK